MRARGRWSRATVTLALVFALCSCGREGSEEPDPGSAAQGRSVVLVTVEAWWRADLGEPLADLGGLVRYDDALSACPQTRPAAVSLLTGSGPDRNGVRDDRLDRLAEDVGYLPAALRERGLGTAAFLGSATLGFGSGLDRGFDLFDAPRQPVVYGPYKHFGFARPADVVVSNARSWIEGRTERTPFFAWIHLVGAAPPRRPGSRSQAWPEWGEAVRDLLAALPDGTVVWIAGLAGPIDPGDPSRSGYLLTPEVLRVPLWHRPAGAPAPDPGAALWLPDLAGLILRQTGDVEALGEGGDPAEPGRVRWAWTWRGALEIGWPPQTAAVAGGLMLHREGDEGDLRAFSWPGGEPSKGPVPVELTAALDRRAAPATASRHPRREIPETLLREVAERGEAMPPLPEGPPSFSPLEARLASLRKLLDARSLLAESGRAEALEAYREAMALDERNRAARLELGELYSLTRPRPARKRLDEVRAEDPYNPDVWHALGHLAHKGEQWERADALFRVAVALRPGDPDMLYDLACVRSIREDLSASAEYLGQAWEAGFREINFIQNDPDLRNLRADARFERFMREVVR